MDIYRKKNLDPNHLDAVGLDALFSRLGERPDDPQSQRVSRVVGLLSRLGSDLSKADEIRVLTELRNALHNYEWVSQVSPTPEGYRAVLVPAYRRDLSREDRWEYHAIQTVLAITREDGGLSRLRRCECGNWFYAAKRNGRKFCSGTCRQYHYDSDAEKRKQKRAYMRKLYADQKERAKNPKSGVGLRQKNARKSLR